MQRHNATKNVLALVVNGVAAVVFIVVADVDWRSSALIAVGLGRSAARSGPPSVAGCRRPCCAGVIVVVGVVAMVSLLR